MAAAAVAVLSPADIQSEWPPPSTTCACTWLLIVVDGCESVWSLVEYLRASARRGGAAAADDSGRCPGCRIGGVLRGDSLFSADGAAGIVWGWWLTGWLIGGASPRCVCVCVGLSPFGELCATLVRVVGRKAYFTATRSNSWLAGWSRIMCGGCW